MSHPRRTDMTDVQRKLARNLDLATDTMIAYAAPKVPKLENLTPEGMLEELGRLNTVRKAAEKTEKIIKERFKSTLEGKKELRGDNYHMKIRTSDRTALDQAKAKAYFEKLGILEDFMKTTPVETMTIEEN